MNKKLLAVLSIIAILSSCKKDDGGSNNNGSGGPQITSGAFISNHSVGSKLAGYYLDSGSIKFPVSGSNLSFRYDTVTVRGNWADTLKTPANTTDFASATYMQSTTLNLLGQNQSIAQYYQVSTTSWSNLGDDYGNNVNLSFSGGSAVIPNGTVIQNPSQTLVNFPINYADSFQGSSASALSLTATISGSSIPLTINQITTVNSKNIAWGTLKLTGYTDSMQTVVQKYTSTIATSVVATGTLGPLLQGVLNTYLTPYGFTNGQQTTTLVTYRFWAKDKGLVMTLNSNGVAQVTTGL